MNNPAARRNDEHVFEGLGAPLEKNEPLSVPFHLHGLVPRQSVAATHTTHVQQYNVELEYKV